MSVTIRHHEIDVGVLLRGTLYIPAATGPSPAVVLHHGFGAQRMEGFLAFVQLARTLAAAGFVVAALDRRGQGESDGEFFDLSVEQDIIDAAAMHDHVAALPIVDRESVHSVGMSMGAVIASIAATQTRVPVRSLTMWSVAALWAEEVRSGTLQGRPLDVLETQGYFDFYGLRLGPRIVREAESFDPYERAAGYSGPVRVLHGEEDFVPEHYAARYRTVYGDRMTYTVVPGADHGWGNVPVREMVIDETRRFIEAQHARTESE